MAFDLSELLKDVSHSDTGREQIEYIKLDLIDGDDKNFYELSEVDALANNIATIGLQQPLRVRPHPTEDGRYMVVSGHRRRTALQLLAQEDPTRWEEVACIVDRDTVSPAMQQLRLIFGNANTRKMSSSDLSEQAAQVEKLLYQLKEDGYEFPGRMRDHVAQVVQTSKTKLAKLKMIRDNLAECWQPYYKKGTLGESSAYELSRIPASLQILLFEEKQRTKADIRWLYADDVKKFAERCVAVRDCACDRNDDGVCTNQERKLRKTATIERYAMYYCSKCCADCVHLTSCKNACPKLKDKVAQIKADAKEAQRQAKLAQEEKDRPKIEKLQELWYRFGFARQQAGCAVEEVFKAAGMSYSASDHKLFTDKEDGYAKFDANYSVLPYGYGFRLPDANAIIAVADLFGCSLDYLFCRTDVREMAQDVPKEKVSQSDTGPGNTEIIPGAWYPASVEPPLNERIIILDKDGYADTGKYRGGTNPLDTYCIASWSEVRLWSLDPKEATADSLPPSSVTSTASLEWRSGQEKPQEQLRALARFDMSDGYPPVEVTAYWRGQCWEHRDGLAIDGQCLGWFPLPAKVPKPSPALNSQCVTGLNPYGHCGSASCCSEPYNCCKDCPDPCNSRCGYLEDGE